MHILVSRTDRAGDLILTLPLFQILRRRFPQARLTAHVRSYTAPLLAGRGDVDGVILDDQAGRPLPLVVLARSLRRMQIDAAVLVHPAGRAVAACFLAGIPVRIGRASNVWMPLLTHRLQQNRSANRKHEAAYNIDLLTPLGIEPEWETPRLSPLPAAVAWGREALAAAGLEGRPPVFVHPGHGGSAVNLPLSRYRTLVERLGRLGFPVALTLGPGEESLAEEFPPAVPGSFGVVAGVPDLGRLAGLLANGAGFWGGSTGPTHLAAGLGLPTVAFFPLLPAMTPVRWGPCGPRVRICQPADRDCPGRCGGCRRGNCLAAVDLEAELDWAVRAMAARREEESDA